VAKQKKGKLLKATLGLAAASAAYYALGNFLYGLVFTRRAASRGFAGWPVDGIVTGEAVRRPKSPVEKVLARLTGQSYEMEGFIKSPNFREFQADVQWYMDRPPEKAVIPSPRGASRDARIHADVIRNEAPSDVWLILLHGFTCCPWSNAGLVREFHRWGFNVLQPHLCGHGESEDPFVSMGWLDRIDVLAWINYLIDEYEDPKIILFGSSMGAGTVMMTTGEALPDNVICAIEDCGYTSVRDLLASAAGHVLPEGLLTELGLSALDAVTRLRAGFSLKEASCVKQLKKSKTPTLFVHGEEDDSVPFRMLQEVYDAAACEKAMLTIPGAGHSEFLKSPELFFGTVQAFIIKHLGRELPPYSIAGK